MTRLSVIEEEEGWMKLTVSFGATEKLCQLMEAFWLDWVMSVTPGVLEMAALPVVTVPPVGEAEQIVAPATSAETTREIFPPFSILNRDV